MTGYPPPSRIGTIDRIDAALDRVRALLRWAGLAVLAVMITLPAVQIFLRQVLRAPFIGAEELTRFMLICVVFVTLPYVVSSGANIRMEEFLQMLPARLRRAMLGLVALVACGAFGLAAYSVALATLGNLRNATPTLGIPYWIFFSAAFLGLLIAAIECALQALKLAMGREPHIVLDIERQTGDEPTLGGH